MSLYTLTSIFTTGTMNRTDLLNSSAEPPSNHLSHTLPNPSPEMLSILLNPSSICLALLLALCAFNLKSLPFIWHLRVLNAFRFTIRTLRPPVALRPSMVFQPIITTSSADLFETDFNLHKTNSSYFSDADVARAHLMSTLFAAAPARTRGPGGRSSGSGFGLWTRILAWDDKWFYVVTHFVRKGAGCPGESSLYPIQTPRGGSGEAETEGDLYATALSRCVFKSGRKTVVPGDMLRLAGLVPCDEGDEDGESSLADVEERRLRGLELAHTPGRENQLALEAEFNGGEGEVLGRHTDGTGIAGVVLTLLQLAGLKRTSYL
ncbi:putative thioesterase atnL [Colletotrichum sidae]|uniref:Putative thioesterase atnL n=1 Tax=Colletotrichum sidae TaxID=1347389 RepID=A0A4R8T7C3_9PEZI|nr:putative thioesterase atnL [Colletotrichum sidae]